MVYEMDEDVLFQQQKQKFVGDVYRWADVDAAVILQKALDDLYQGKAHVIPNPDLADDGATIYDIEFEEN
jgi:hypothetical protein